MIGGYIPKKAQARKNTRRSKGKTFENPKIRYASYIITIFLILIMALCVVLYNTTLISQPDLEAYSSIALSLLLSSLVFSYLFYKGNTIKQIIIQLGLSRDKLTFKMLGIGILIFLSVIVFGLGLSVFSTLTNIQLPTNVQTVLAGTPIYFLIFTFLIAPINEEIFFRGLLVPRIGIIISAVIFAILHLSYLSISEFAAALFFGLVAGYVYKKTTSLYPSILAHMIVNFITITSLIYLGMLVHL